MEVIAVKASDGTIRVAFNACQVCADSGKGYYVQEGDYLVCQNCGTKFSINQIGISKNGCNPAPILDDEMNKEADLIIIPKEILSANKDLFVY